MTNLAIERTPSAHDAPLSDPPHPRSRPRAVARSRRSSTATGSAITYATLAERVSRLASARWRNSASGRATRSR